MRAQPVGRGSDPWPAPGVPRSAARAGHRSNRGNPWHIERCPFAFGAVPTQSNLRRATGTIRAVSEPLEISITAWTSSVSAYTILFTVPATGPIRSAPLLNEVNIFWGRRRRIVTKNFVGGEIVNIFGGFDIDLGESDIQGSEVAIEVVTIFGGGEIRVPGNWEVIMETVGIFGGCNIVPSTQTRPAAARPLRTLSSSATETTRHQGCGDLRGPRHQELTATHGIRYSPNSAASYSIYWAGFPCRDAHVPAGPARRIELA